MQSDELAARGVRVQVRRWFVETGWTDGNGLDLWRHTDESVEVTSKVEAEALRDEWLSRGKIEIDRWNQWKRTGPYGAFRIRSVWEDATPAALAASPEGRAMLAEERAKVWKAVRTTVQLYIDKRSPPQDDEDECQIDVLEQVVATINRAEAAALKGETK